MVVVPSSDVDASRSPDGFTELLASAQNGEEEAWRVLYRSTAPQVRGYLIARGVRDVDDTLGEAFLHAARSIERFSGDERAFKAWLFAIARNRAIDAGRRKQRRVSEVTAEDPPDPPVGDVETEALANLVTGDLLNLLDALPAGQRDVLLLRIIGDLTIDEVARVLRKTPGSIKALQRRGLRRLKRSFPDPYP